MNRLDDLHEPSTIPARQFDDGQLGRLQEIVSSIECECPQHLASIVYCLATFEQYASHCEHQNAEDAEIHRLLHVSTAHARALMERALIQLCAYEGIAL